MAGPFANLVLAVVLLAADRSCWGPGTLVFWGGMAFLGFLQVTAFLLNLLPIPGLDGYGALEPHLSPGHSAGTGARQRVGFPHPAVLLIAPRLNQLFFAVVLWFFGLVRRAPASGWRSAVD